MFKKICLFLVGLLVSFSVNAADEAASSKSREDCGKKNVRRQLFKFDEPEEGLSPLAKKLKYDSAKDISAKAERVVLEALERYFTKEELKNISFIIWTDRKKAISLDKLPSQDAGPFLGGVTFFTKRGVRSLLQISGVIERAQKRARIPVNKRISSSREELESAIK